MLRSLPIVALLSCSLLAGALLPGPARGQATRVPSPDTSDDSNVPDPRGLREEAEMNYRVAMRVLQEQKIDAVTKRTIGHRNCGNDKACHQQVDLTYRDEMREIQNRSTERIALHRKVLLEISEMERNYKTHQRLRKIVPRPQ